MAFTVRVELHSAKESDYTTLHSAMNRLGFSRTIRSSDGKIYHLPPAEYDYQRATIGDQVRDLASQAAKTTGKSYSVLVTEVTARWWYNLQQASATSQLLYGQI